MNGCFFVKSVGVFYQAFHHLFNALVFIISEVAPKSLRQNSAFAVIIQTPNVGEQYRLLTQSQALAVNGDAHHHL